MSKRSEGEGPQRPMIMSDGRGPWGGGGPPEQGDPGQNPAGEPERPAQSPWLPPSETPPPGRGSTGGGGRRGLDDMFRGSRGPFGPQLPQLPGGRSLWLWLGLGVAGLWLLSTSIWRIEPEQEGVVTRFGSYSRTVGPGINFTFPAPIESMQKVAVRAIQTEDIPGGTGENLVLTGDSNIIDLAYSVRWSIKQPERFLFSLDAPEETIRAVGESAMRATIANFTLQQAIGSGRTDIERQVQQRMQQILDSYRSGIRIEGVAVRDSGPPQPVVEAFTNVNAARQRAEARQNEARAYAQQVVRRAEGEAGAFDRVYAEYRLAPEVTRRRIYYETMERILRQSNKTVVESGGVTPYLPRPEVRRRTAPEATTRAPESGGTTTATPPASRGGA